MERVEMGAEGLPDEQAAIVDALLELLLLLVSLDCAGCAAKMCAQLNPNGVQILPLLLSVYTASLSRRDRLLRRLFWRLAKEGPASELAISKCPRRIER